MMMLDSLDTQLAKLEDSGVDMSIYHNVDLRYEFACFEDLQQMYGRTYHPEHGHLLKKSRIGDRYFLTLPLKIKLTVRDFIWILNCYNSMAEDCNGFFDCWKVRLKAI